MTTTYHYNGSGDGDIYGDAEGDGGYNFFDNYHDGAGWQGYYNGDGEGAAGDWGYGNDGGCGFGDGNPYGDGFGNGEGCTPNLSYILISDCPFEAMAFL